MMTLTRSFKFIPKAKTNNTSWNNIIFTLFHSSDDPRAPDKHTVKHNHVEKTPITAQLWQMRKSQHEKEAVMNESTSTPQTELLAKTTKDSKLILMYNFSKDQTLRDLYVDHRGNVLIGKLFEDLDALAGNIAHMHCSDSDPLTPRPSLVTASVDRIIQTKPILIQNDLLLAGQVAWVGKSSMDIVIELHNSSEVEKQSGIDNLTIGGGHSHDDDSSLLLSSYFTYVARNVLTSKAVDINPLVPSTPLEQTLFANRAALAQDRKTRSKTHYTNKNTSLNELAISLVESGCAVEDMPALAHPSVILMKSTTLENSFICQPQNVNMSGRVFGGFLMHRAFDLALSTSYTFAGVYPEFQEVDRIAFRKPVDIGDLVRLKSRVVYASDGAARSRATMRVEVNCQVVRPERASSFVSNTFSFVFRFRELVQLRKVLPSTLEEAHTLISHSGES